MELSRHIAELTEKLEELRSEKAMLLSSLEYPEDTGIDVIQKDISAMEAGLQKLEQQESQYSVELKNALDEYKRLQEHSIEIDPIELYRARKALRPTKEASAVSRVKSAHGDKYNPWLMFDSKRDVSEMLGDEKAERSVREQLRKLQQEQRQKEIADRPHIQKKKIGKDNAKGWQKCPLFAYMSIFSVS